MNSKQISIIVAVIIIIGLGVFMLKGRPASAPAEQNGVSTEPSNTSEKTDVASGQNTLQNLLKAGIAQKCTFSDNVEGGLSKGIFYLNNGKARGDFDVTTDGQLTKSHMIVDGQTSYIWTDNLATGVKMTLNENSPSATTASTQQFDTNKEINYECGAWVVDASLFTPPSSVTFSDLSALMPNVPAQSDSSSKCAACDSAPESARAQCRAALGCE